MTQPGDPLAHLTDEEVRVLPPDYTLKKLVGEDVDVAQLFSPENVAKAQEVIHEHKNSFLEWVAKDIATLEEHYANASGNLAACDGEIKKLARTAFVIKSQAGTFGFSLGTAVAKSLDDFCAKHFSPTKEHMVVIRKHIDTLALIFAKNISGDGGKTGGELADTLALLVSKYKKS